MGTSLRTVKGVALASSWVLIDHFRAALRSKSPAVYNAAIIYSGACKIIYAPSVNNYTEMYLWAGESSSSTRAELAIFTTGGDCFRRFCGGQNRH